MRKLITLPISLFAILFSTVALANKLSTSATVPASSGNLSVGSNASIQSIIGLNQFNPTIGTLEKVEFIVENTFNVTLQVDGISISDSSVPHTIFGFAGPQISLAVDAGNHKSLLFATGLASTVVSCDGDGGFACTDGLTFSVSRSYERSEDATARLLDENLFDDFIGSNKIIFISLEIADFGLTSFPPFSNANVDLGNIGTNIDFMMGPATVTVDYIYSPIPEVNTAWLFCLGIVILCISTGCGNRSRRQL